MPGSVSPHAPVKYSRYRSVRQQAEVSKSPQPVPEQKKQNAPVSRSMSRYRPPRSVIPKNDQSTSPQSLPLIPALPRVPDLRTPTRRATEPLSSPQRIQGSDRIGARQSSRQRETEGERLQRKAREIQDQEEQRQKEEQQKLDAKAEQVRQAEALLAEQKRKDLERLEAELDAAVPGLARVVSPRDKFGFFTRKKAATKVTPPSTASGTRSSEEPPRIGPLQGGNAPPRSEPRQSSQEAPKRGIEPGGGVVVPGTDAPMSAVNAGERVSCAVLAVVQF